MSPIRPLIRWQTWETEEEAVREIASSRSEEDMYYARQTLYFLLQEVVEEIEEENAKMRGGT